MSAHWLQLKFYCLWIEYGCIFNERHQRATWHPPFLRFYGKEKMYDKLRNLLFFTQTILISLEMEN